MISRLCFWLFLLPFYSQAEERQWPAKDLKSLLIQAKSLKLKVEDKKSPFYTIKAGKDFSFKEEEGRLKIQSKDFPSKKLWSESESELELSLSGPSLPIDLFASSSKVSVIGWKSPLFISSFKGHVELQNTAGAFQMDLYEGQALIKSHKGDLKLKSFQTDLSLADSQGLFDFMVNKGSLKIKNSGGRLDFVGSQLKLNINGFKGDIKGFTESGAVSASLKPKQLELKTGTAPVRIYVKGRGPEIDIYTREGSIYAPRYLYKKFEGKSVRVSGQMRSRMREGHIKVETERGKVYIN